MFFFSKLKTCYKKETSEFIDIFSGYVYSFFHGRILIVLERLQNVSKLVQIRCA